MADIVLPYDPDRSRLGNIGHQAAALIHLPTNVGRREGIRSMRC
jgi:hypothetical protein